MSSARPEPVQPMLKIGDIARHAELSIDAVRCALPRTSALFMHRASGSQRGIRFSTLLRREARTVDGRRTVGLDERGLAEPVAELAWLIFRNRRPLVDRHQSRGCGDDGSQATEGIT